LDLGIVVFLESFLLRLLMARLYNIDYEFQSYEACTFWFAVPEYGKLLDADGKGLVFWLIEHPWLKPFRSQD
jgi:hypothetical protein